MSELVESTVRKHCAMWETGLTPGAFGLTPNAPAALFPAAGESAALEAVVRYRGAVPPHQYKYQYAVSHSATNTVYFVIDENAEGDIRAMYWAVPPSVEISAVWSGGVADTWYHVLGVLDNDGADNIIVKLYIDGILRDDTGMALPYPPFSGVELEWLIGGYGAYITCGDIALVRNWVGSWPTESELPNHAWYPPGTAGLRGQWDMSPGAGNTIYDSGGGGHDLPWIPNTQANASYAHYRFTGQPRGQLWQPR